MMSSTYRISGFNGTVVACLKADKRRRTQGGKTMADRIIEESTLFTIVAAAADP